MCLCVYVCVFVCVFVYVHVWCALPASVYLLRVWNALAHVHMTCTCHMHMHMCMHMYDTDMYGVRGSGRVLIYVMTCVFV